MSARPFQLGSFDCGIWLADWCVECRGIDPASGMREHYRSIEQAFELTGARSLPVLFNKLFRGVGIRRTHHPCYGDAAVIKIGDSEVRGAIVTSGYVVIAAGGGLSRVAFTHARRVCAWSIVSGDRLHA